MAEQQIDEAEVFNTARKIECPEARQKYLDEACGDDAALRARVSRLLGEFDAQPSFLEHPAVEGIPREILADTTGGLDANADSSRPTPHADDIPLDFLEPASQPGSLGRLGQYDILEVVGRGGMGIVLKALDSKLNRVVAVKVLAPELAAATARKRFSREAQAAAAVSHDHVVTIYAVEDGDGSEELPYLVMEFIDGESLQEKIERRGPLDIKEILRIGRQVAAGLAAAHAQGLIHRDVKPSNVLLQNGVQRVWVTDFGLARAVDDVGMTRTGEVTGTPQYMSPEQAQGRAVDARSDLFSLGSVLYAMCTGRSPFRAETSVASLRRVCDDLPRPLWEVIPDVPKWLVEIIDRLLEKDADKRFQTGEEVAELLGKRLAQLQEPVSTSFPGTVRAGQLNPARAGGLRKQWLVAGVVLLAAVVSLGVTEATGVTHFTASVISIVRGDGTLIVEVDDPDVSVTIEGADIVISGAGPREVRLRPGQYAVRAERDGEPVEQKLVTITRGEKEVVTISLVPNSPAETVGEVLRFAEHTWHVWSVAFSPDGRHVLSAGGPDVICWDVKSGAVVRRYDGHGHPNVDGALSVIFSPDGESFFTGGANGAIREWDLETGEVLRRLDERAKVFRMALSRDRSRLLSTANETATVWDVTSGEQFTSFTSHREIHSVALTPDGRRALTADYGGTVLHWNAETGEVLRQFENCCGEATFHPDGRHALTGLMQSVVMLDLETGEEVRRYVGHTEPVNRIAVSPDGSMILSNSYDLTVRLWDGETGEQLARFDGHTDIPTELAFSPDGRFAISGSQRRDSTVRVWALPATLHQSPATEDQVE